MRRTHKSRHQRLVEAKAAAFDRLHDEAACADRWDDGLTIADLDERLFDELIRRGLLERKPPRYTPANPDFVLPKISSEEVEARVAIFGAFLAALPL